MNFNWRQYTYPNVFAINPELFYTHITNTWYDMNESDQRRIAPRRPDERLKKSVMTTLNSGDTRKDIELVIASC